MAKDNSRILRVEGVPGLGWVLKRSLFENEILPKWPNMNQVKRIESPHSYSILLNSKLVSPTTGTCGCVCPTCCAAATA